MHRFLALDIGAKRTGVALVDDAVKVATPLTVISHAVSSPEFMKALNELSSEWEPYAFVFGLPIDLKGKHAIAANNVRELAENLMKKINESRTEPYEWHFVDERLSTAQAERSMKDQDVSASKRKELRDALAATVIAQSFIDTL